MTSVPFPVEVEPGEPVQVLLEYRLAVIVKVVPDDGVGVSLAPAVTAAALNVAVLGLPLPVSWTHSESLKLAPDGTVAVNLM
jgi:hypothetical protein